MPARQPRSPPGRLRTRHPSPASPPRPARLPAQPPPGLAARILLLDDTVLILDKPAGLPVHRGPSGGPSLEDWLPALALGKRRPPQPAHRLDTDTAGCLVLGRTRPALAELGALFAAGRARKTYWAIVSGEPRADRGEIDLPLRKVSTRATGWRMEAHPDGQPARTTWRVLGRGEGLAWLELRPHTGRTHQLRVHCAALGCPILGDARYGGVSATQPMHLMSQAIALPLNPPRHAVAPVPEAFRPAFLACGWKPGGSHGPGIGAVSPP
ncbi:RNA pseudouridine synthase [Roseomonas sp. NAR14]|uniref:RNA pseudouridine synthase n=1 Tax=Roseomonas acroporae TaxID=2937791 RepID=A0A9X2BSI3_9PROT|nr:RNA pseudouridine synthase [Roseomonas acroporae]MCK8783583.1 RNA pseudouridine synthase [Roseomonas acroporae]